MLVFCITVVMWSNLHMKIRLAILLTVAYDAESSEHNDICFRMNLSTPALVERTHQVFIRADYSRTREAKQSQYFLPWDNAGYFCDSSLVLEGARAKLMVGIL